MNVLFFKYFNFNFLQPNRNYLIIGINSKAGMRIPGVGWEETVALPLSHQCIVLSYLLSTPLGVSEWQMAAKLWGFLSLPLKALGYRWNWSEQPLRWVRGSKQMLLWRSQQKTQHTYIVGCYCQLCAHLKYFVQIFTKPATGTWLLDTSYSEWSWKTLKAVSMWVCASSKAGKSPGTCMVLEVVFPFRWRMTQAIFMQISVVEYVVGREQYLYCKVLSTKQSTKCKKCFYY